MLNYHELPGPPAYDRLISIKRDGLYFVEITFMAFFEGRGQGYHLFTEEVEIYKAMTNSQFRKYYEYELEGSEFDIEHLDEDDIQNAYDGDFLCRKNKCFCCTF